MKVQLTAPEDGRLLTDGAVVSIADAKRQLIEVTDHWLRMAHFTSSDLAKQAAWILGLFWKITDDDGRVLEQGTIADIPREDHEYSPEELDRR